MEIIISALTISGISALAIISYNHGEQFRAVSNWLAFGAMAVGFGLWIWQSALFAAEAAISESGAYQEWELISAALDSLKLNMLFVAAFTPLAVLYLGILHFWVSRLKE